MGEDICHGIRQDRGKDYGQRNAELYTEQRAFLAEIQSPGSGRGTGSDGSASGADEICCDLYQQSG